MDAAADSKTPVTVGSPERIVVLDILRGLALLIMVIAHVGDQAGRGVGFGVEVRLWIKWFIAGKGLTIFAILFGASFAIILGRLTSKGRSVVGPFLRRLVGIAAFGVVTTGVFGYGILLDYAVTAVPLLFIRRWSVRALVILAIVCPGWYGLNHVAIGTYRWSTMGLEAANAAYKAPTPPTPPTAEDVAWRNEALSARTGTSFVGFAATGLKGLWRKVSRWPNNAGFVNPNLWPSVFSYFDFGYFLLFIVGLLGVRLGVFVRPAEHRRLLVGALVFGVANWTTWRLGWRLFGWPVTGVPDEVTAGLGNYLGVLWGFGRGLGQWLALAYISVVLLLVSYSTAWEHRLAWLAAAGRLALTNYLAQIVIISLVFSDWGFAWTGLQKTFAPAVGLLLFVGLALASRAWLVRFRMGPAEWILSSVTYWRLQPFRRQSGESSE